MKIYSFILLAILWSCSPETKEESVASEATNIETYNNPILAGWYPDPAITSDGKGNFYMVHSTFAYFPGIPVFHSTDLVNWKQIGNVIHRPEQLDLEGFGVSRAIFAPDISYDNGTFYVTCTVVDGGGNFVVTAKDPAGPWSDLTYLPEVRGIDPGLFFDENDKTYLVYNSDAPNNEPLYPGHRTIRMVEFDKNELKVISDNRILVNGGVDLSTKPIWAEGPRIYKENGYYYLMTAEGGTAVNHSEMIYRTKDIDSTFVPWDQNPILTQRDLNPDRPNPITSAGHADIVQHPNGDWYGIFLACRDYDDDHYNTGRETFLTPVKWVDDWPVFDLDGEAIKYQYPVPEGTSIDPTLFPLNGNFSYTDDFDSDSTRINWMFLRTPKSDWYDFEDGKLVMQTRAENLNGTKNPSFIAIRQQHLNSIMTTSVDFEPANENEEAGLVAYQNGEHYYALVLKERTGSKVVIAQMATEEGIRELGLIALPKGQESVELKIESGTEVYTLSAKIGDKWMVMAKPDARYLSTKVARGFVGVNYGIFTTSNGEESTNSALFDWWKYAGNDPTYSPIN